MTTALWCILSFVSQLYCETKMSIIASLKWHETLLWLDLGLYLHGVSAAQIFIYAVSRERLAVRKNNDRHG